MPPKINFAFGIHNHQPVGNFDKVFEEAYKKSYLPFLDCLKRHPGIKLVLHNSGPLWDFFLKEKPEYIDKLRSLVKTGQIEMLSGGYYEPILINISDRDKIGQIKKMNRVVYRETGYKPRGMWCAERVWEPYLAKPICLADIKYTVLDENHFRCAGLGEDDIFGYYVTEEQGHPLLVIPISYYLRQSIPYAPPEEIIARLQNWATEEGNRLAVFADDGEKFGVWPNSFRIAWEERWLDRFFNLLEQNAEWINMVTFSEYMDKFDPIGRIYLPTASYFEMSTWALPPKTGKKFGDIIDRYKKEGKWDEYRYFIRGGFWRNFLVKYPESNRIQKKALFISEKVNKMVTNAKEEAINELYQGQCNCAYWHGVFGGIYLPHLRHAVQEHLIKAENIADDEIHKGEPFKETMRLDINRDLKEEIIINTQKLNISFMPHVGGALYELIYKPKAINFCDTLTRRPESYHDSISHLKDDVEGKLQKDAYITDGASAKEIELKDLLKYDSYDRYSFLDHFLTDGVDIDPFRNCEYEEAGDFIGAPYDIFISAKDDKAVLTLSRRGEIIKYKESYPVEIEKTFFISESGNSIQVQYWIINDSDRALKINYGCEIDFSILSKNMETNYVYLEKTIVEKEEERVEIEKFPLDSVGKCENLSKISIQDGHRKVKIHFITEETAESLWRFPIETISKSESGFEKIYQSTVLMPLWKINLEPGEAWENNMEIVFEDMIDE